MGLAPRGCGGQALHSWAPAMLASCSGRADPPPPDRCASFASYQGHAGKTVSIMIGISPEDSATWQSSWADFESCTGIHIDLQLNSDEKQLVQRAAGWRRPDLGVTPMPAQVAALVHHSEAGATRPVPAPAAVANNVATWWKADWAKDGGRGRSAVRGAVRLQREVPGLVLAEAVRGRPLRGGHHLERPHGVVGTDRPAGKYPWCGGLGSSTATGWPATDWLEEIVLGMGKPTTYDDWVAHRIRYDSPLIRTAMRILQGWMHNPAWVNGGDVSSVATVEWSEAGLPLLDNGRCWMFPQASFYASQWGPSVTIGKDGDVFAFYLPGYKPDQPRRILGGGDFVVAFSNSPEVRAFQTYLSTPQWATSRAALGNYVSANSGVPLATYRDPIDQLSATYLTSKDYTFRFDGSDLQPADVNHAEWKQLTAWFGQDKDTTQVLNAIDAAWPTSTVP